MHTNAGEKSFLCKERGLNFTRSKNFPAHKRIHSGVGSHRCIECDASFIQQSHLECQMRSHTGEKPLVCIDGARNLSDHNMLKFRRKTLVDGSPNPVQSARQYSLEEESSAATCGATSL